MESLAARFGKGDKETGNCALIETNVQGEKELSSEAKAGERVKESNSRS